MKDPRLFIATIFVILFIFFGFEKIRADNESEKNGVLIDSIGVLNTELSVLKQINDDKSLTNLIIINHMCKRDQRLLKQDSVYLNLLTKFN